MGHFLKTLLSEKDGTASLHKIGNLAAQIILGFVVLYSYFYKNLGIDYVFVYMGVATGNMMFIQAAEFVGKMNPKQIQATESGFKELIGEVVKQVGNLQKPTPTQSETPVQPTKQAPELKTGSSNMTVNTNSQSNQG